MDISTIIGMVGVVAMVLFASFAAGGNPLFLLDLPSFLVVVVGSYFAVGVALKLKDTMGIWGIAKRCFSIPTFNEKSIIQKMVAFSEKARREGLLALEDELEDLDDEFMKKGLRLVVDGTDGAIIRDLLELELGQMQARHAEKQGWFFTWGALAPALGMMGTIVGLVNMLQNLDDRAAIGPNMAMAIITTLYGSMVANTFCVPFATKLKAHSAVESNSKEMVIEGVLSIQAGDNTRVLAMKLMAYLTPADRKVMEAEMNT
ncbi:MAG: MotA/TolQ/ExbB proton channel family protein [Spirochaetes bacterium]|nr:MotA/TolQ/ExbB proton channel family protein [Spirochaetota bacterium]